MREAHTRPKKKPDSSCPQEAKGPHCSQGQRVFCFKAKTQGRTVSDSSSPAADGPGSLGQRFRAADSRDQESSEPRPPHGRKPEGGSCEQRPCEVNSRHRVLAVGGAGRNAHRVSRSRRGSGGGTTSRCLKQNRRGFPFLSCIMQTLRLPPLAFWMCPPAPGRSWSLCRLTGLARHPPCTTPC